jgi:hypothetical protein
VAVNDWGPQFPITLCGERYFVTAYKEAPFRMMSTTSGEPAPLWWRNIPAEYRVPLWQGRKLLAPGEEKSARLLVLLSNSARASGAPQPAAPGQLVPSFDSLLAWWKKHGDKLVVIDPWLRILEKQKVD